MKSRKYLSFVPMAAAGALLIYWITFKVSEFPAFEDLTEINNDNRESIGLAVDQISNANQFLISLVTTLFGVCGYFLNKHKSDLKIIPLAIGYVISLFLLAFAYYSAFKVYTSLVNSIVRMQLLYRRVAVIHSFILRKNLSSAGAPVSFC
jgi:hypothetical protein